MVVYNNDEKNLLAVGGRRVLDLRRKGIFCYINAWRPFGDHVLAHIKWR